MYFTQNYQKQTANTMNTRRKFIANGSMAAAALLASRPFKAIAGNSSFSLLNNRQSHLVFIHTAGLQTGTHLPTLKFIREIKNKTSNTLLFNASSESYSTGLSYDSSVSNSNAEGYHIITKGGIHTGVIAIDSNETGAINRVNTLAAFLKNEKNCKVVVCMSQLGFSNNNKCDDKELAEKSTHIDLIIGSNAENFTKHPIILRNSQKHEVILQSASSNDAAFGKIEMGFDAQGNKNHIHILNKIPEKEGQKHCIVAA
jgi:hypothetical protein